jgi:hypothetical protein
MICTGDFLFDRDALCLHGQMPFDIVKAIVCRFDSFDLGKFSIDVCLYIRALKLENFTEKRMNISDNFI